MNATDKVISERDYILISDLRTVRIIKEAARHLIAENNPHVDAAGYKQMMRALSKWEDDMYAAIEERIE